MHVTVSMATYNTPPDLLHLAIGSVLTQTHRDLRLIVVNDGGDPLPPMPRDSRLTVVDLPTNRGRYFVDAAVLATIDDGAFAILDADDRLHPEHLDRLLDRLPEGDGVAVGPYLRLDPGETTPTHRPVNRELLLREGARWGHITHWCAGLSTVDRVRAAGGILPVPKVGFDTLHLLLLAMTGPVTVTEEATYTWVRRHGSLTSDRRTGFHSSAREQAKRTLMRVHAEAVRARREGRPIPPILDRRWPDPLRAAVANAADRVRSAS